MFLKKLKEPQNDIERSFYQYQCQIKLNKKKNVFLIRIISTLILLPVILYLLICNIKKREQNCQSCLFWDPLGIDIVPISLQKKYHPYIINEKEIGYIKYEDIKIILNVIKRVGFYPDFILKITIRISYYRKLISKYKPEAIIATCEYSYTSSILTEYCEINNVKHINVMHGEKLLDIRDSFFRFTKCYIWDKHYQSLFIELRADRKQFVIELPPSMKLKKNNSNLKNINFVDYKFYIDTFNRENAIKLKKYCDLLINSGMKVSIRPHPFYTNKKILHKFFLDEMIEDNKIDISTSIFSTNFVVAKASTVLNQAYLNGKSIIIDDITNPKEFALLKEANYIAFKYKHKLLSEVLKNLMQS